MVKSLAYQLAHQLPALAEHYVSLNPATLMTLHQPDTAARELLVLPLAQHLRGQQARRGGAGARVLSARWLGRGTARLAPQCVSLLARQVLLLLDALDEADKPVPASAATLGLGGGLGGSLGGTHGSAAFHAALAASQGPSPLDNKVLQVR